MARRERQPKIDLSAHKVAVERRAQENGVPLEPELHTLGWYATDWPARRREFIEREVKIRNAFARNQLEPFRLNEAQAILLDADNEAALNPSLESVVLKCRRLGISTFYLAARFADCVVLPGRHARVVAQDPDTLRTLMQTLKVMFDELRPELKPESKYNSIYDLQFANGSRISVSAVAPGHEEKGRGDTFTHLHMTEIPFWRGDGERAAVSLTDAAKGGIISFESTANGVGDLFHRKYQQGKKGEGNVRSFFFPWWWNRNYRVKGARFVVEGYNVYLLLPHEQWETMFDEEKAKARLTSFSEEERREAKRPLQSEEKCADAIVDDLNGRLGIPSGISRSDYMAECLAWRRLEIEKKGERKFSIEYPENDEDCFASTGRPIIDHAYLTVTCEPEQPRENREYAIGVDVSLGLEGRDFSAIEIIDVWSGRQVYHEELSVPPDVLAGKVAELSDRYNWASIVVERNGPGLATIQKLRELGYEDRLYIHFDEKLIRQIEDGKLSADEARALAQFGFPTTTVTKPLIAIALEEAVRTGALGLSSPEWVAECRTCVWEDNGAWGAMSGYHDDGVMALGIVWLATRLLRGGQGFIGVLPETGGGA